MTTASSATAAQLLGVTSYEDKKAATAGKGRSEMGKQDFLTLFTAQLQNQNPLDPVKNEAFVAQLAQFSQLESLTNMQTSLDALSTTMKSSRVMDSAALIGRSVAVSNGTASLAASGSVAASIDLPNGASGVTVQVRDATGQLVQTLVAGVQPMGTLNFAWDGTNSAGARAPAGSYTLTANGVVNGANQALEVQTLNTITAVTHDATSGEITLQTAGGGSVALSAVKRLAQ